MGQIRYSKRNMVSERQHRNGLGAYIPLYDKTISIGDFDDIASNQLNQSTFPYTWPHMTLASAKHYSKAKKQNTSNSSEPEPEMLRLSLHHMLHMMMVK